MFAFHGVDYMEIDALLSDQEKLVRQTVREFVDKEIMPHIEEWNREGKFPKHLVPLMAELGFYGANLEGYGCAGMSNVEYGLIMQELERGDSGLRSFVSVQGALVMYPIKEYGSEEQKQRWLPALQQGKAIGCFGLTEPDFGSNPAGMRTRAVRDGDSYISEWREGLDYLRHNCRRGRGVGAHGRRCPRVSRGERHAGLHLERHQREMVATRFSHLQPVIPGRARARLQHAPQSPGDESAAKLPDASPLRHRVGGNRGSHGLLQRGLGVREDTKAV